MTSDQEISELEELNRLVEEENENKMNQQGTQFT
jgi:hypothetical protein